MFCSTLYHCLCAKLMDKVLCFVVLVVFLVSLVYPILPVSLDCPFLITLLVSLTFIYWYNRKWSFNFYLNDLLQVRRTKHSSYLIDKRWLIHLKVYVKQKCYLISTSICHIWKSMGSVMVNLLVSSAVDHEFDSR